MQGFSESHEVISGLCTVAVFQIDRHEPLSGTGVSIRYRISSYTGVMNTAAQDWPASFKMAQLGIGYEVQL